MGLQIGTRPAEPRDVNICEDEGEAELEERDHLIPPPGLAIVPHLAARRTKEASPSTLQCCLVLFTKLARYANDAMQAGVE